MATEVIRILPNLIAIMEIFENVVDSCFAQKMKFSIKNADFQETADLVIFIEKIFNGKLYFLRSVKIC